MNKDSKFFKLLTLFLTFLKIGGLTFGGGYAMIPIIEEEVSRKRKWITELEILDVIAISESTPGAVAVNTATYVGYRVAGVWGAIFATLGLALPSFIIIFIISFFYEKFLEWQFVQAIFKGLKVGVILLLFNALIKLSKGVKFNVISVVLFVLVLILMLLLSIFNISFRYTSLCLIAFGLLIGVILTLINKKEEKE